MHSTRFTQVLLAALGLVSVAQASGIRYNARGIMVRQDDGDNESLIPTILPGVPEDGDDDDGDDGAATSNLPGSSPSSPPAPTTSAVEPPPQTTTSEEETPTSTPEEEPSTTETPPEPSTSAGNDAPSTTSSENDPPRSTSSPDEPSSTSANEDDAPSTTRTPVVSTAIETVIRTNSDGSETTMTSSTLTTTTPDPHSGDENGGGGGGMSANTRNIVIGVVVGVGGAILLGALGVVAWRIRNRKKAAEENDGLMGDYNAGYSQMDKSEPPSSAAGTNLSSTGAGAGRSPFQSTLENYHQPTQPVNASSNF